MIKTKVRVGQVRDRIRMTLRVMQISTCYEVVQCEKSKLKSGKSDCGDNLYS